MSGTLLVGLVEHTTTEQAFEVRARLVDLMGEDVNIVVISGVRSLLYVP